MSSRRVLILDLDGTLIPSLVEWDELRLRVSSMLKVPPGMLKPLGERLLSMHLDDAMRRRIFKLIEEYELKAVDKLDSSKLMDRSRLLLDARRRGFTVVVVSMRSSKTLKAALERLGIQGLVDATISRDQASSRKEQLLLVLSELRPRCAVFVGDSEGDENAGKSVGVPTVIVECYRDLGRILGEAYSICSESSSPNT